MRVPGVSLALAGKDGCIAASGTVTQGGDARGRHMEMPVTAAFPFAGAPDIAPQREAG
jgi:hypothetical protein